MSVGEGVRRLLRFTKLSFHGPRASRLRPSGPFFARFLLFWFIGYLCRACAGKENPPPLLLLSWPSFKGPFPSLVSSRHALNGDGMLRCSGELHGLSRFNEGS